MKRHIVKDRFEYRPSWWLSLCRERTGLSQNGDPRGKKKCSSCSCFWACSHKQQRWDYTSIIHLFYLRRMAYQRHNKHLTWNDTPIWQFIWMQYSSNTVSIRHGVFFGHEVQEQRELELKLFKRVYFPLWPITPDSVWDPHVPPSSHCCHYDFSERLFKTAKQQLPCKKKKKNTAKERLKPFRRL